MKPSANSSPQLATAEFDIKWKRLKGFALLTLVANNVKFKDGVKVLEESDRSAA